MSTRYFRNSSNVLVELTEYDELATPDGLTAIEESVIQAAYSGNIYIGGTWDGTTYTPPTTQPDEKHFLRARIWRAYLWWRVNGRTDHWVTLRSGNINIQVRPLHATDRWVHHQCALADRLIRGDFPTPALTSSALESAIAHIEEVLLTLGPTWYQVMVNNSELMTSWDGAPILDDSTIYSDIINSTGAPRAADGSYNAIFTTIRPGFNKETPSLGN